MAKKTSIIISDDIDGSPGAETVSFSFDGQGYEIDLGPTNRQRLRESLQAFTEAGRLTGRRTSPRRTPKRTDLAAIRAWAAEHGVPVSERGRISAEVIGKYDAVH